MNLRRFLGYFLRLQSDEPALTTVRFKIGEAEFLSVQLVEFDAATNAWTVQLSRQSG